MRIKNEHAFNRTIKRLRNSSHIPYRSFTPITTHHNGKEEPGSRASVSEKPLYIVELKRIMMPYYIHEKNVPQRIKNVKKRKNVTKNKKRL